MSSAPDEGITRIAVPTPFAVGRVNCYLVDDDPLTLVDTGPNSGTSLTELEAKLGEHGRRVEDLERIVLTHQHLDHVGLAQILADRSGAEIVALDELAPWLARYGMSMDADDEFAESLLHSNGVPPDVTAVLRAVTASFRAWGASAEVTRTVAAGDTLQFANRSWSVHLRPGHSPSDTVFHDAQRRLLIGGDHLIRHISSNALISRPLDGSTPAQRPQPLVTYMASLTQTREMELDLVLAGHGEPVDDHRGLIDERFRMHERRVRKIGKLIADGPLTAYEIAQTLWGNVAVTQAFLTISEVLGHVDILINEGSVAERPDAGGVVRFEAVA